MGLSDAYYFFAMKPNWCPSSTMPQIEYDPSIILEHAVGVERRHFTADNRDCKLKETIRRGMPVMIIEPRVEMEWAFFTVTSGTTSFMDAAILTI